MKFPNYAGIAYLNEARLDTANANRDGTGTLVEIAAGVAGGRRMQGAVITPIGNTSAGMVRFFLQNGAGAKRLFIEEQIPAGAPSATEPVVSKFVEFPAGFTLPEGWKLYASTERAEAMNVFPWGGDFGVEE